MTTPAAAPRKLPNSTWAEIRTAHASGIGLRELARSMGIPAGTVLARARREGWTQRREHARSLAVTPAAHPARTPSEAAAVSIAERGQRHLQRVAGIVEKTLPAVERMKPGAILDRIEDIDRLDKIGRRTFGLDEGGSGVVRIDIYANVPERAIAGIDVETAVMRDGVTESE